MKLWIRRSHHYFWDSISNQFLKEESRSCNTLNLCNQFDNDHKIYTTMMWLGDRTSYNEVALVVQKTPPKHIFSVQIICLYTVSSCLCLCVHACLSPGLTEFVKLSEDLRTVHRSFLLKAPLRKYQIWSQIDELSLGRWINYPCFISVPINSMNKTPAAF